MKTCILCNRQFSSNFSYYSHLNTKKHIKKHNLIFDTNIKILTSDPNYELKKQKKIEDFFPIRVAPFQGREVRNIPQ